MSLNALLNLWYAQPHAWGLQSGEYKNLSLAWCREDCR